MRGCDARGGDYGVYMYAVGYGPQTATEIADTVINGSRYGLYLHDGGAAQFSVAIQRNRIIRATVQAMEVYVQSSGESGVVAVEGNVIEVRNVGACCVCVCVRVLWLVRCAAWVAVR